MWLKSLIKKDILEFMEKPLASENFLLDVVDIDMKDEDGKVIGTRKYSVFEDEYGKYVEIYFEGTGKQKVYITNKKQILSGE